MRLNIQAPSFWEYGPGVLPTLLRPLASMISFGGVIRRVAARPVQLPVPVICVGNLVVGGAGKTPVVLSLLPLLRDLLPDAGRAIHILSRGYGGRVREPLRVNVDRHDAGLVGDEPLLLARAAPTWVGRSRLSTARSAVAEGARLLLLDDGYQDPSLAKSVSLLVIDGGYGLGNGLVIPAGPLRETASAGLARADGVVLIGKDGRRVLSALPSGMPVLSADVEPGPEARGLPGSKVFAFAGIGRPKKFFEMLRDSGLAVAGVRSFPDHHRYRPEELMALLDAAEALRAIPVTTEKDYVRLPLEARPMVHPISLAFTWKEPGLVRAFLRSALAT